MVKRIYVCDKDKQALEFMAKFFYGSSEFEVGTFTSPDQMPEKAPHILILDGKYMKVVKAIRAKYPTAFIICADVPEKLPDLKLEYGGKYVSSYLKKPYSVYDIIEELHRLTPNANTFKLSGRDIEEKLSNIMIRAGLAPQVKGFMYIHDAVMLTLSDPKTYGKKLTKTLYPTIAERYNTNPACVERAMRFAINNAFEYGRLENINTALGIKIFSNGEKPTSGELIALLVEKLTHEQRHMKPAETSTEL